MSNTRKAFVAESPIDLDTANREVLTKFKHIKKTLYQIIKQPKLTSNLIWVGNGYTTEDNQQCVIRLTIYWSQKNQNFIYFKERIKFNNIQNH